MKLLQQFTALTLTGLRDYNLIFRLCMKRYEMRPTQNYKERKRNNLVMTIKLVKFKYIKRVLDRPCHADFLKCT